jgi:DeoR/GlpR family transcriptional regulator of sugar metabolism
MLSSAPDRRADILHMLDERDVVSSRELAERLQVTPMTVWRDLVCLEERGLVRRQRGRVTRVPASRVDEPAFEAKRDFAYAAKAAITRCAAEQFIREGDDIAIDGGTTVALLAEQTLPARLTIATNSLNTARLFLNHPSRPAVYCCGGFLREQSGTFIGREALSFFGKRRFRRYFLSATGVDARAGVTDLTLEDNEVKQAMASASEEVVLLADQSKWGVVSHMQVLPWRRIHHFITDTPRRKLKALAMVKSARGERIVAGGMPTDR